MIQGVGDHIRDGLRFSGSRRTVQDETLALARGADGGKLRGVGGQGRRHVDGIDRVVEFFGGQEIVGVPPVQSTREQGRDDLVGFEIGGTAPQIVIHNEVREREVGEDDRLRHVPTRHLHHRVPHRREHVAQIAVSVLVLRERIDVGDRDPVVVAEHFEQGDVEARLVLTRPEQKVLAHRGADKLDGKQNERGEVRLLRRVGLVPAQEAEREIERVRAALFQPRLRGTEQVVQRAGQFLGVVRRMDPSLPELRTQEVLDRVGGVPQVDEPFPVPDGDLGLLRATQNRIFGVVARQGIEEFFALTDEDLHRGTVEREVQQRVAKRQIEQFPLPELFAGHLGVARPFHRAFRRRGIVAVARAFRRRGNEIEERVALRVEPTERHRQDPARAHAPEIEREPETVLVRKARVRRRHRVLEFGFFREAGERHEGEFLDPLRRPFGQLGRVVLDALGEEGVDQPHADVTGAFLEHDDRVQIRRFKAGGEEQSEVEGRAVALHFQRFGKPDLLSRLLVAARRFLHPEFFLLQGEEDRLHLFHDRSGILFLVPRERTFLRQAFQVRRGGFHQVGEIGMPRLHERAGRFGKEFRPRPFVVGEKANGRLDLRDGLPVEEKRDADHGVLRRRQGDEGRGVHLQFGRQDLVIDPRADLLHGEGGGAEDRGVAGYRHRKTGQRSAGQIFDSDLPDHGNPALLQSEIHHRGKLRGKGRDAIQTRVLLTSGRFPENAKRT